MVCVLVAAIVLAGCGCKNNQEDPNNGDNAGQDEDLS